MPYLFKGYDIKSVLLDRVIRLGDSEIALKLNNPILSTHSFHGVDWQPHISGFDNNRQDNYDEECIVAFPLIPQYFHNVYEIFTKILKLRNTGEKFKVVFVYFNNASKIDNVFDFIIKKENDQYFNASHIYDFFQYFKDIDLLCLTQAEFENLKVKHCYVFFDSYFYGYDKSNPIYDDITYEYQGKLYEINHFLKVPADELIANSAQILRHSFPKYATIDNYKVYISRKKANDRKYVKEKELEDFMTDLGYQVVFMENISMPDQIKIIQMAKRIVCLYGSALVNCSIFANSSTKILALNPTYGYSIGVYELGFKYYDIDFQTYNIDNSNAKNFETVKNIIGWWDNE